MIGVNQSNALAVNTESYLEMSDYFFDKTTIFKINKFRNWGFFVKANIDQDFYEETLYLNMRHPELKNDLFGVYSISATFIKSNKSLTRFYNVTNCK